MNVMFQIGDKLITPSEDTDTILRGITKRSVIELAQSWGIVVEERPVKVEEVISAIKNNQLKDAFGIGTAATIAPIAKIGFRDTAFDLTELPREYSKRIKAALDCIKTGSEPDVHNWCLKV